MKNIDKVAEESELKAFVDQANAIPPGVYCIPGTLLENLFRKNIWIWVDREGDETTLTTSTGKTMCLPGFEMKSVTVDKEDVTGLVTSIRRKVSIVYSKAFAEAGSREFGKGRKQAIELLYLFVGYVRRSRAKYGDNQADKK